MRWDEYNVRQRIEGQMAMQGISKAELSRRTGIHHTAISPLFRKLETASVAHVQLGTLYRICEALGLTITWTLTGEGFMYEAERKKAGASYAQEAPADLPFALMRMSSQPKRQPKPRQVKLPSQPRGPRVAPSASKKSHGA